MYKKKIWIESEKYPGYYAIPGIERYVINEDSELLNVVGLTKTKGSIGKRGYRVVNLRPSLNKNSIQKQYYIHRLVAFAFLKPVKGKNLINHKDSNRLNNHYTNLEWCDQRENMVHAANAGRMNDKEVKRFKIWNVKEDPTRQGIKTYGCYNEAARNTSCSSKSIRYALKMKDGNNHYIVNKYLVKYVDDLTPWPPAKTIKLTSSGRDRISLELYRISDGKVFTEDSISKLANITGISQYRISNEWRKGKDYMGGWLMRLSNSNIDWKDILEDYYKDFFDIIVFNPKDGNQTIYSDGVSVGKALNISPSNVTGVLRNNKSSLNKGKWYIKKFPSNCEIYDNVLKQYKIAT